ncbi:MAG: MFS transporter [Candidatus Hodarchaeales archaeon]
MQTQVSAKLGSKIVFWTSLGHFSNHVGNYLTPALLIYLQTDIPLSQTERGILGSVPMILLVFLSSFVGYLGDKKPLWSKHFLWLGILGIGAFGILMSLALSFLELFLATIVLGFALSTFHPLAFNYINNLPDKDKNMGILSVSGNFGSAITPILAMVLFVITKDWRLTFLLFSLMQLIIGISFATLFPNEKTMIEKLNNNGHMEEEGVPFSHNQIIVLTILIVFVSVFRAPVFRCISYFTTVIFSDAFAFSKIESSILS